MRGGNTRLVITLQADEPPKEMPQNDVAMGPLRTSSEKYMAGDVKQSLINNKHMHLWRGERFDKSHIQVILNNLLEDAQPRVKSHSPAIEVLQALTISARTIRHRIEFNKSLTQTTVDAVLIDFINYVGSRYGIDYALYAKDLASPEES